MKTLPLRDVLIAVADLGGVQYDRQLSPAQQGQCIRFVNSALANIWEDFQWPELSDVREHYFWPPAYDPHVANNAGDIVRWQLDGATYYVRFVKPTPENLDARDALIAAVSRDTPTYATAVVQEVVPWGSKKAIMFTTALKKGSLLAGDLIFVPNPEWNSHVGYYHQAQTVAVQTMIADSGRAGAVVDDYAVTITGNPAYDFVLRAGRPVGETNENMEISTMCEPANFDRYIPLPSWADAVLNAWDVDPHAEDARGGDVKYDLSDGKVRFPGRADLTSAWLELRRKCPRFSALPWEPAAAAVVGMVRFYETEETGDCYICIAARDGDAGNPVPSADAAHWELLPFPALFAEFVRYAASADVLRAGGKDDTATLRDRKAEEARERALNGVNNLQNQTARPRVRVRR